ncbi:MAG: calcium-binding protein [Pirellulales bacterium]
MSTRNAQYKRSTKHVFCCENLEGRQLMAAQVFFDSATGIAHAEGTSTTNDKVIVKVDTKGTAAVSDDRLIVQLTTSNGQTKSGNYSLATVKKVEFHGYSGDDYFENQTAVPSLANGGAGADTLIGGSGPDELYGSTGNDYLDGRGGNDNLSGAADNDILFGDLGDDYVSGGSGNDYLFGGAGRDQLFGNDGDDWLDGGADTEFRMNGGIGVDTYIDDSVNFPSGWLLAEDRATTKHSAAAMFDYNNANDSTRWSTRLDAVKNKTASLAPDLVESLNPKVLAFAQSKLGQFVGDGGCTRLIEAALVSVGAKPGSTFQSPGFYIWGRKLNVGEAMQPGNIIQFAPGTRFETATSSLWMDSVFGHAAIIESVIGTKITVLNQNMSGSPVIRTTLDLSTITVGSFSVYEAMPA